MKNQETLFSFETLIPFFKVVNFKLDQTRNYGSYVKLMVKRSTKKSTLLSIVRKHRKQNGMYLTTGRNQTTYKDGKMVPVTNTYTIAVDELVKDLNSQGITAFKYEDFENSITIENI